jgi:hypothetical protein
VYEEVLSLFVNNEPLFENAEVFLKRPEASS